MCLESQEDRSYKYKTQLMLKYFFKYILYPCLCFVTLIESGEIMENDKAISISICEALAYLDDWVEAQPEHMQTQLRAGFTAFATAALTAPPRATGRHLYLV